MTGRELVPLAEFLDSLPGDAREAAEAAADRIDALEDQVGPQGWLERNLISLALISLALFAVGLGALIGLLPMVNGLIGLGGITILVMLFPGLMLTYLLSVRGRTAIDNEKMAINDRHFLPHGGVYFSGPPGGGHGMVMRIDPATVEAPTLRDKVQAQYDAATKRRW